MEQAILAMGIIQTIVILAVIVYLFIRRIPERVDRDFGQQIRQQVEALQLKVVVEHLQQPPLVPDTSIERQAKEYEERILQKLKEIQDKEGVKEYGDLNEVVHNELDAMLHPKGGQS